MFFYKRMNPCCPFGTFYKRAVTPLFVGHVMRTFVMFGWARRKIASVQAHTSILAHILLPSDTISAQPASTVFHLETQIHNPNVIAMQIE